VTYKRGWCTVRGVTYKRVQRRECIVRGVTYKTGRCTER